MAEPICTCGHSREDHETLGGHAICAIYPCLCMAYEPAIDALTRADSGKLTLRVLEKAAMYRALHRPEHNHLEYLGSMRMMAQKQLFEALDAMADAMGAKRD